MNHWIGTSGFQYPEWKGTFYPEDMSTAKMLPYYAERFSTTEVNYTFRRIPSAKTIQNWWDATPERFKFSLKAPQKVTHFAKLQNCGDTLRYFYQVISDLEAKLGVVLFQLPPAFKKDATLLASFLDELPPGGDTCSRRASWIDGPACGERAAQARAISGLPGRKALGGSCETRCSPSSVSAARPREPV